jgi:AGZA family xanthine/uracil permease-like MFS transporter
MHGEAIGINQTPTVAISYLAVAAFLVGCAKYATVAPAPVSAPILLEHEHAPGE